MPERVEGYETDAEALRGGPGAISWIDGLRREARRAMIRRLVFERIRSGGYEARPNPHGGLSGTETESSPQTPSRAGRFLEAVVIGVTVAIVVPVVCSCLGLKRGGD